MPGTSPSIVADGVWYIDLLFQDAPSLIAAAVLETDAGLVLIDPGPAATLGRLQQGLQARGFSLDDVHALLLTHIHLDHAGATGTLVRQQPGMPVYVHRRGALHLENPRWLLRGAAQVYGAQMDALWGECLPVPAANLHVVRDGEVLNLGGRVIEVAYTPGHAVHHVSYLDQATGVALVGDTCGMCISGTGVVIPMAPPPDVNLAAWFASLDALCRWEPQQLFLTHFGPVVDGAAHMERMRHALHAWSDAVQHALQDERTDAERAAAFHAAKVQELKQRLPPTWIPAYDQFGQPELSWYGIARYLRKKKGDAVG